MRRFEFIEGSSAKFWSADVEGQKFIVVYGKIGTAGSRKEKEFTSAELAFKEYEKKVAEKLREGYKEIEGGVAPTPPPAASSEKREAKEAKKAGLTPIPSRWKSGGVTTEGITAAAKALHHWDEAIGGKRSWRTKLEAKRARRALERLGGVDPAEHEELRTIVDKLLKRSGVGKGMLSVQRTLDLLWGLDVRVYERQIEVWKASAHPTREAALWLKLAEQFPEPELSFRLGCLLLDQPGRGISGNEAAWSQLWREVAPHLQARLTQQGTTLRKFLQTIDTTEDPSLTARVARLKEH